MSKAQEDTREIVAVLCGLVGLIAAVLLFGSLGLVAVWIIGGFFLLAWLVAIPVLLVMILRRLPSPDKQT